MRNGKQSEFNANLDRLPPSLGKFQYCPIYL